MLSLVKASFTKCTSRKKQTMSSKEKTNLILDVPLEILRNYSQCLDLKSNIMFNLVCKRTCDKQSMKLSEFNTVLRMFTSITNMIKNLQSTFRTQESQNKLLAVMLRRLIYTSVSDVVSQTEVSYISSRTWAEYTRLMNILVEELDISVMDFNNILEDAQFEFRGFSIINLSKEQREKLDKAKIILRNQYFSKDFTVHTCSTFGNMYLEFQCNDKYISIDIHEKLEDDMFTWIFLTDSVRNMMRDKPTNPLILKLQSQNVDISDSMISWDKNNENALYVLTELVHSTMDCSSMFKGTDDNLLEVWNDTVEVNWLLREMVDEVQVCGMYSSIFRDVTSCVQDAYEMAHLC